MARSRATEQVENVAFVAVLAGIGLAIWVLWSYVGPWAGETAIATLLVGWGGYVLWPAKH